MLKYVSPLLAFLGGNGPQMCLRNISGKNRFVDLYSFLQELPKENTMISIMGYIHQNLNLFNMGKAIA